MKCISCRENSMCMSPVLGARASIFEELGLKWLYSWKYGGSVWRNSGYIVLKILGSWDKEWLYQTCIKQRSSSSWVETELERDAHVRLDLLKRPLLLSGQDKGDFDYGGDSEKGEKLRSILKVSLIGLGYSLTLEVEVKNTKCCYQSWCLWLGSCLDGSDFHRGLGVDHGGMRQA